MRSRAALLLLPLSRRATSSGSSRGQPTLLTFLCGTSRSSGSTGSFPCCPLGHNESNGSRSTIGTPLGDRCAHARADGNGCRSRVGRDGARSWFERFPFTSSTTQRAAQSARTGRHAHTSLCRLPTPRTLCSRTHVATPGTRTTLCSLTTIATNHRTRPGCGGDPCAARRFVLTHRLLRTGSLPERHDDLG